MPEARPALGPDLGDLAAAPEEVAIGRRRQNRNRRPGMMPTDRRQRAERNDHIAQRTELDDQDTFFGGIVRRWVRQGLGHHRPFSPPASESGRAPMRRAGA